MSKQIQSSDQAAATTPAATPIIQCKLNLGAVNDPLEHEADAVAEQVMRMPQPHFVQRKCADCEEEKLQRKPDISFLQRKAHSDGAKISAGAANRIEAARGGGDPLPAPTKSFMESRFGTDFSNVRVHTDQAAAEVSTELQAHAFTVGNDLFFNAGKFSPDSGDGAHLLAHELTHTIQQRGNGLGVQRDYAIDPSHPDAEGRVLTDERIQAAIEYNTRRFHEPAEIGMIRDIIGLDADPAVIDADFINAIADYQAQFGETSDGKIGGNTMVRLLREINAESRSLTDAGLDRGSMEVAFTLQTQLEGLITANNTAYPAYRSAIRNASILNKTHVLMNTALLRRLNNTLTFEHFSMLMELLGRTIPGAHRMMNSAVVQAALATAFAASNVAVTHWPTASVRNPTHACNPVPGAPAPLAHEEGGWIYMNLITGALTTEPAPAGVQAGLQIDNPPEVADSIIIGIFHTHPNVGPCWVGNPDPVFLSPEDINVAATRGVPVIARGAFPTPADVVDVIGGRERLHLAGGHLFPGATGGVMPQANSEAFELSGLL